MKRFICILMLALFLGLNVTGCDNAGNQLVKPPILSGNMQTTGTPELDDYRIQYLPKEVENPEGLPILKWVCLTEYFFGGMNRSWSEEAVNELNEMLVQLGQPFRVQFVMLSLDHMELDTAWFARPGVQELLADADLIFADMDAQEMKQYLSPITKYITDGDELTLKNAVPHSLNWVRSTVDGEIYGIPSIANQSYVMAWRVNSGTLEKYGLAPTDFSADIEEMEALFAQIFEKNGKRPFLYAPDGYSSTHADLYGLQNPTVPGILSNLFYNDYQLIGSCYGLDFSSGTPKVVSMLEGDNIRKWQAALLRFRDCGYITREPNQIEIVLTTVGANEVHTTPDGSLCIPVGEPIFPYEVASGMVCGISAASKNQESAAKLLSLIAEDKAFRMQLLYGKEGRDYTIKDGYYSIVHHENGTDYSLDFLSPLGYFCGLVSDPNGYPISPTTEQNGFPEIGSKTKLEVYRETLDQSRKYLPIVFDFSDLETEIAQTDAIMQRYFGIFTNNVQKEDNPNTPENEFVPRMDEANYQIMLDELAAAGGDKIQAELQRQLDEWLAENPDWSK